MHLRYFYEGRISGCLEGGRQKPEEVGQPRPGPRDSLKLGLLWASSHAQLLPRYFEPQFPACFLEDPFHPAGLGPASTQVPERETQGAPERQLYSFPFQIHILLPCHKVVSFRQRTLAKKENQGHWGRGHPGCLVPRMDPPIPRGQPASPAPECAPTAPPACRPHSLSIYLFTAWPMRVGQRHRGARAPVTFLLSQGLPPTAPTLSLAEHHSER